MSAHSVSRRFVSVGECMIEMSGGMQNQYRLGYAGDTLNTAWYARACLPADWQVDYVTALGDDVYSAQIREFMANNNIGTDFIQSIKGKRPGLYLIHQRDGDRHFTYWRETSAARQLADDQMALDAAFADAGLIYVSGITLGILSDRARTSLIDAIAKARQAGAKIAFDPNVRPALWADNAACAKAIEHLCAHVDIALPTFDDDQILFGDADLSETVSRYRSYGVSEIVIKNGADPALIVGADEQVEVAAKSTDQVVDATGAGDSFSGAYLSARLTGASLSNAADAAHSIAAQVICHAGALVPFETLAL